MTGEAGRETVIVSQVSDSRVSPGSPAARSRAIRPPTRAEVAADAGPTAPSRPAARRQMPVSAPMRPAFTAAASSAWSRSAWSA